MKCTHKVSDEHGILLYWFKLMCTYVSFYVNVASPLVSRVRCFILFIYKYK